jgi:hypothetical protein
MERWPKRYLFAQRSEQNINLVALYSLPMCYASPYFHSDGHFTLFPIGEVRRGIV